MLTTGIYCFADTKKIPSALAFGSEESIVKNVTLTGSSALMKKWYEQYFVEFDLTTDIILNELRGIGFIDYISQLKLDLLHVEINRFLLMLRAENYKSFHLNLAGGFKGEVQISLRGCKKFRSGLERMASIGDSDELSDEELLEMYWIFESQIGRGNRYYVGICLEESYYQFKKLSTVKTNFSGNTPDLFPEDRLATGVRISESSFNWDNSDPEKDIQRYGEILVADVRMLIKTSEVNIAYPIALRLWWSEKRRLWTPWFLAQHNIQFPSVGIVF